MRQSRSSVLIVGRRYYLLAILFVAFLSGCSTLPPGAEFSKTESSALAHPEETQLGWQFANAAREHNGNSGFRIIPVGADGFLMRMQMIHAAERTLDLQYFIFRGARNRATVDRYSAACG